MHSLKHAVCLWSVRTHTAVLPGLHQKDKSHSHWQRDYVIARSGLYSRYLMDRRGLVFSHMPIHVALQK